MTNTTTIQAEEIMRRKRGKAGATNDNEKVREVGEAFHICVVLQVECNKRIDDECSEQVCVQVGGAAP